MQEEPVRFSSEFKGEFVLFNEQPGLGNGC